MRSLVKSRSVFSVLLLFALAGLAGCASPARTGMMTVPSGAVTVASAQSPFHQAVAIASVSGGKATNPLWTSEVGQLEFEGALRDSLTNNALLARVAPSRFELHAILKSVDQPLFGFDMTVTSSIAYRVVETESRASWFDELVTVSYTAKFADSLLGVERLKLANEGSIKTNIRTFIEELVRRKSPRNMPKPKGVKK
jgi:hypothetical protein